MEANKILQADVLDILFEGRNKAYGAYNLRKTYDRRLITALLIMLSIIAVIFTAYVVTGKMGLTDKQVFAPEDPHLVKFIIDKPVKPQVLPAPPKTQVPKAETVQFTTPPRIVPDKDVKQYEMPPAVTTLEDTKIGSISRDGVKDEGITAPPVSDNGKGILEAPRKMVKEEDSTFITVQIESQYPGGAGAWMRYLNKTFRYPDEAQVIDVQGTIVVQFIVDKEGNISDVEAISGPATGGLREEAVRVIRKSGRWEPAVQNGRKVKSYKRQPIIFRIDN